METRNRLTVFRGEKEVDKCGKKGKGLVRDHA